MFKLPIQEDRPIDFICMGRANVDLYPTELGQTLGQASAFVKHVGGSPANIAVGLSRLGAQVSFISVVSDDPLGNYVVAYLKEAGIDTTNILKDTTGTRTSLAFAEIIPEKSDVVFYRNNASDLQLSHPQIQEAQFDQAKALVITGSSFSASPSRETLFHAIDMAHQKDVLVFFDLDFRPSEWHNLHDVALYYQMAAEKADVVIGTHEEFMVTYPSAAEAQQNRHVEAVILDLLERHPRYVILKEGKHGATLLTEDGKHVQQSAFQVDAIKPYGAGDAFAASLFYGILHQEPTQEVMQNAAAAAALVVTRVGCADAMPDPSEIEEFLKHSKLNQGY